MHLVKGKTAAAAGGSAEHAGVAAEGDGQMLQEMHHQPGLLPGQQRPKMFISVYGPVRKITRNSVTLYLSSLQVHGLF